jgi:hypothetical protein
LHFAFLINILNYYFLSGRKVREYFLHPEVCAGAGRAAGRHGSGLLRVISIHLAYRVLGAEGRRGFLFPRSVGRGNIFYDFLLLFCAVQKRAWNQEITAAVKKAGFA